MRPVLAICRRDLILWLRQPWLWGSALLVPLSYTLIVYLGSQATNLEPVAVVNNDHGPVAAQLTRSIAGAGVFRATVTTPAQARQMYDTLQVAAIITIPADLDRRAAAHKQTSILVRIDNMNLDFTGDIRRSVPDAILAYYQQQGQASPVRVTMADQMMRPRDVQIYQYSILPVIIFVITVNGTIAAGMGAAGEFERRTVKPLLMAPVSRAAIITGKTLAGFLSTTVLATGLLAGGAAFGWTRPQGLKFWLAALAIIALAAAFAAGAGIVVGTWFQRKQPVSIAATIVAVDLFALAGGIGVISFEPLWLQRVAAYDPLTYAVKALQMAVFYDSITGFPRDAVILAASAAAAITAGTLAMKRGLVAQ